IVARLDTKYFLWGVFRDVKSNHILHESHRELPSLVSAMEYVCDGPAAMDNAEATDMVVDMEGGKIVGPVDVVVSKELYGKACGSHEKGDVNPANETMLSEPKQGQKRSSSRVQGSAGAGGIVRDESGKWILGYSKNLGTSNSLASELWALYHGLNLVWERGFRKVLVECNSHEAVKCLELPTSFLDPNRALILSCREYLCRNWDCKLQLILREANSCANWLAAHCENQPLGSLAVFDTPPYALAPIFQKDSTGIVQTRSH
ncbi:hypothetical protein CUMW_167830, partial [Citrus unshiu]